MRLIDADELKKNSYRDDWNIAGVTVEDIDNAPTVDCIEFNQAKELIKQAYQKGKDIRPQGEWFDCIEAGILKARHGDYVLYKVDYLLDNLTREVYIMEGARRMRGEEND